MKRVILLMVCLAVITATVPCAVQAVDYRIRDLGALSGTSNRVCGINDLGQIVGWSYYGGYDVRSFVWQNGVRQTLQSNEALGSCKAIDINNRGDILGADMYSHPLVWRGGIPELLPTGGISSVSATAINNNGQVAAIVDGHLPGIWRDGVLQQLNTSGTEARIYDINDSADMAGSYYDIDYYTHEMNQVPCVWWGGASWQTSISGWGAGRVVAINNQKQVLLCTDYNYQNGRYNHIYLIDDIDKRIYREVPATYVSSLIPVKALNDHGQLVCEYDKDADPNRAITGSYLWENGVRTNLPDFGADCSVSDINNNGQIVGMAYDLSGNAHLVMWEVVPEPSSMMVLVCGVGALAGAISRRRR